MTDNKKSPSWTDSQQDAIHKSGCQLLVAAGAGSGKTSVLTERILTKILQGSDIDNFLVVTFTVASAEDMKEKLRKKLLEKYAEDTGNTHLSKQIAKLPFAQISTIAAFCLKLVKQNFSVLHLPSGVRIADEGEASELFESALDELFDNLFSQNDEDLHKLLEFSACRGNEIRLSEYLTEAYGKLRAHPHYLKKLEELSENFKNYASECTSVSTALQGEYGKIICDAIDYVADLPMNDLKAMEEIASFGGETLATITDKYISYFKNGAALAREHKFAESANAFLESDDFCTSGWRKGKPYENLDIDEKKAYDELKATTRKQAQKASAFFTEMDSYFLSDIKLCSELMIAFKNIIFSLDKIFTQMKKEKGIVDFTDAEQLAYSLLIDETGNPSSLCKEISSSLEEVLVDEYQDTNPLQDALFSALATKDNRFMVGDDKQSIYRFRNAYPDIFNGYKKSFKTPDASCVFLRENFRCSKEIIDFTNSVFDFLWGEEYKNESLVFAKVSENEKNEKVTVKTFITDLKNKESSVCEARYIANEILRLKKSYIKENGESLLFSDIAILLPVAKNITDIFIDELRKKGVPVTSKRQGLLIGAPEIKVMLSILKAINNPEEDVPLASAMNSFFFGFTADELAKIREYKDTSLWGSVNACCRNRRIFSRLKLKAKRREKTASKKKITIRKNLVDSLKSKCREFVKELSELREKAKSMECKHLIWYILENKGVLSEMENEKDGEIKKGNLLLLYSDAISFGKKEYKTLSAFLKHTESLTTQTYSAEGVDAVSIMTIHASKGLEFPVCFLANAGKNLSGGSMIKMPVVNMKSGIFMPLRQDEFSTRECAFYKACEIIEKPEENAENQRKLYVALTRAREKLYIVGSSSEKYSLRNAKATDGKNYLSWILSSNPDGEYYEEMLVPTEEDTEEEAFIIEDVISDVSEDVTDDEFVYPYKESENIPAKLSVSELKESTGDEYIKSIRKKNFLSVPAFAAETKRVSATEIGTANHTFMQFASFENCIKYGVEYEAQRLLLTDMITDEQYGMLNFKNIKQFFNSTLWEKIKKSPKVYREKRFTVMDNSASLLGKGNETVLVQGVIDLFFENEDGTYTVVDYKTDKALEGSEEILATRYKGQLAYYAKAVKGITGKEVSNGIIYSFALGKEIPIEIQ